MTNLLTLLGSQGYDYIDGPIRSHKLLQVWCKKGMDRNTVFDLLDNLYQSPVVLVKDENPALYVNYGAKQNYDIGLGITVLDQILKSTGIGDLGLQSKLKGGKSLSIAYNNAVTIEYSQGNLSNYFYATGAGFKYSNPELLNYANKDNLILITGILYARNMQVSVNSDIDFDANLGVEINKIAKGKIDASYSNSKELVMKSDLDTSYPIAIRAFRLNFEKDKYKSMELITDRRSGLY